MDYRDKIIKQIADFECERITRKVILSLQKRNDSLRVGNYLCFTPSRNESGLKNIWEEICVQQKSCEFSQFWDYFAFEAERLIEPEVEKLPEHTQEAIWLQIEENWNYEEGDEMLIGINELSQYIAKEYIYFKARKWSNKRIEQYMDNEYWRFLNDY